MNKLQPKQKWLFALAFTIVGALLTVSINLNDNALDLLPSTAVRGDLQLLQKLGLVDRIIISLSTEDLSNNNTTNIAILKRSTLSLGKYLENSAFFTNVIYHIPQNFELETYQKFQPLLPLLLDKQDYHQLAPLTEPAGIELSMKKNFNLLNSPAGYGIKRQIQSDPLGITPLFLNKLHYLKAEYSLIIEDGLFLSKDRKNSLIIAESRKGLIDADAALFMNTILTKAFQAELAPGITPRIIGSLPHTLANAKSVQRDLKTLLPIATLFLLALLLFALRNIRALLVLGIPFLAALPAIAITGLFFRDVSALALGFGIVLLGIAVDFAIHLYLGLVREDNRDDFLTIIRKPILLATVTTASVFIVLLFSEVPSHRQMATLALSGILLAVAYSWYLVPLIVPKTKGNIPLSASVFQFNPSLFGRYCIFLSWAILLGCGIVSWPGLKYNGNLQTLDAPNQSVIEDERHFRQIWGDKGDQAFLVASATDLNQALHTNYFIFKELQKHSIKSFQSIAPILPSLEYQSDNLSQWQTFWQTREPEFHSAFQDAAIKFGFSQNAFSPFFDSLTRLPQPTSIFENLPYGLKMLADAMIRLPEQQKGNSHNNNYLVTTTVSTNDDLYGLLLKLDDHYQNITLLANKKWKDQVEKLLRRDIITLSLTAAALITLITLISFRSIRMAVAVLAPVLSALSAMAIFSSVTGRELNMMHLLMGIMVIGLAVDYGIFTACSHGNKKRSTSLHAISICAMSSLIGFGVLSFAHHPALNALGITVLIGIGAAWPTAILVTPTIMGKSHIPDNNDLS